MNLYSILGVEENAKKQEIKAAYRKAAKRYHPDKEGGEADKFNLRGLVKNMSKWIKSLDRSPDEEGNYLGYIEKGLKHVPCIKICTFFNNRWMAINGSSWPKMPHPVYWQDLPEPPEKE